MSGNAIFGHLTGPDGIGAIAAVGALFLLRALNGKISTSDTWIHSGTAIPTDLAFVAFSLYFASLGKVKVIDPWVGVYGLGYIISFLLVHALQSCSEKCHQKLKEKWQNQLMLVTFFGTGLFISIVMLNTAFNEFQGG